MLRVCALVAVVAFVAPVRADDKDWTGKSVKLTEGVKLGRKLAGGLVRDGAALDKSKTYVVKSDDGQFLELVGEAGFIFRSEAEVVAGRAMPKKGDAAKKDAKDVWAFGTKVLPKKRASQIQFGDRDADGNQTHFQMSGIMPMEVRLDNGYGWARIHDRYREGWVSKDDLVTKEDAPIYWDKAVKANPNDTWALFMRGNGWWQKGEPDNAIKDFDECIRLDPSDAAAYTARGNAWSAKKEYEKAIADHTEAIRLKPEMAIAHSNRGLAWSAKKEYEKAIADYTEAIRLDPKYALAHNNRGNAWRDKKEYEKAIADFDQALELDPKSAYATGNKSRTLAKLKKYDDAVKGFEAALKLDPMDWLSREYSLFLASCPDAKYRDGKRAVELAKKGIEKAGKDADWNDFAALAAAYAETGDFELAVAEQRKALDDKSLDAEDKKKMEARLELYRAKKPFRDDE